MKWTQQNILNAHFRDSGPRYSPTSLEDWKSSRDCFMRIVILTNFGLISRNLAIFSSPGDSKLTCDGLGLQWNGHSKTFWTLTFELLGRNIASLHFKTKRVAETALRASWFWPTSARFPGTWGIFCSPGVVSFVCVSTENILRMPASTWIRTIDKSNEHPSNRISIESDWCDKFRVHVTFCFE